MPAHRQPTQCAAIGSAAQCSRNNQYPSGFERIEEARTKIRTIEEGLRLEIERKIFCSNPLGFNRHKVHEGT